MADKKSKSFSNSFMRGDGCLWAIYIGLCIISFLEVFSATSSLAYKSEFNSDPVWSHTVHLLVGLGALLFFQSVKEKGIPKWGMLFYWSSIVLLIMTLFFGRRIQGATRDVFGIQPAEVVKIGLVLMLSYMVATAPRKDGKITSGYYWKLLGIIIVPTGFIVCQNLSTAIILGATSMCILWLGNINNKYLLRTIAVVVVAGSVALGGLFILHQVNAPRTESVDLGLLSRANVWEKRVFARDTTALWNQDEFGKNSQVIHAHMALANSYPSPVGRLPGNSQLRDFLPEAYSDYIYAIIFEETGFVGALVVLGLYLALLARASRLAMRTNDEFLRLSLLGFAILITTQALMHIGVCTDAMFVTGQPLPIISRGGSSIVGTSIAFGIMFRISRLIELENQPEGSEV